MNTSLLNGLDHVGGLSPSIAVNARLRVNGKFFVRSRQRLRLHGVTYGPFAPNEAGEPFPEAERVADDFSRMQAIGINAVRTYHLPPDWVLDIAQEQGLGIFVDVPWPKHLCFLDSEDAKAEARRLIHQAAKRGSGRPCVLAYSIGNEISPSVLRWHGARRVERFLAELADVAHQADPDGLITYTSYPPTEYLALPFLDFVTYNVYLHDRATFRRYLLRLQNLAGDRPLLLGELGMDTLRHGELSQADFLAGHVREALLAGLAGAFVFAWTDDWHTGGHPIRDWAFGITDADRQPKAAYHALREVFDASPAALLPKTPRVSVVVCTYNGGRTLEQCLRSLGNLDYPDYDVIVVDDGSTDNTRAILARFPDVRAIHQPNRGLSVARNVGFAAATGVIIAYTDSDCYADPHWLTHLVHQFQCTAAAAVGGPNLTPEDGWLAACVAAAPGQPTHVLESDQVAEHIPGCNMAFRREALAVINGFDPQYTKAGDDVDVCWRLQQAGYWIAFAPGAFVWHHRRQNPRAFLRQQAGYGEAEALLRFKHPDKFNGRGDGKWRGVMYGASLQGLRLGGPIIYRGTFATGLFQTLYQPALAHWAMLPGTLEWHFGACLLALVALFWPPAWMLVASMLCLALTLALAQAAQATLAPAHDGFRSRLLVAALCYAQPLVRSWKRYRTRLFAYRPPMADRALHANGPGPLPLSGLREIAYWSEEGRQRTDLLDAVVAYVNEHGWGKALDSGWERWDIAVYCHPWTVLQICTAQEDHGGQKHLIRVRYQLRPSGYTRAFGAVAGLAMVLALGLLALPAPVEAGLLLGIGAGIAAFCGAVWWRGTRRAAQALAVVEALGGQLGLIRCAPAAE